MIGSVLIIGNKFNRAVRLVLMFFFVIVGGGVVMAYTGGQPQPKVPEKKVVIKTVTEVTPQVLSSSNLKNKVYLVLTRASGEYAFVQVQNAEIQDGKLIGYSELIYQNGDSRLTQEVNGIINLYDNKNKIIESDRVPTSAVEVQHLADL